MIKLNRQNGFTMVELLTVMAIMAILAAIIFPVFAQVKEKARQTGCMSNLREIGSYVAMYKIDNRQYPSTLGPVVDDTNNPSPADYRHNSGIYSNDYVKAITTFHCPSNTVTETKDFITRFDGVSVYSYSNYDMFITDKTAFINVASGAKQYDLNACFQIYKTSWSENPSDMVTNNIVSDGVADSPEERSADFERQLKWKNPPPDTVVTWCANHAQYPFDMQKATGMCLVLFLDGHVDKIPAERVVASLWRVRGKK